MDGSVILKRVLQNWMAGRGLNSCPPQKSYQWRDLVETLIWTITCSRFMD